MMKLCKLCNKEKDINEFYNHQSYCKECMKSISFNSNAKRANVFEFIDVNKIYERDKYKCVKCGGHNNLQIDHIMPLSKGGPNTYSNVRVLCRDCNSKKNNKLEGQLLLSI